MDYQYLWLIKNLHWNYIKAVEMCFTSRVLFVVQKQKFSSDATAIKWFQLECQP